ncbi:MAG TPA: hypothetical protein VFS25_09405 [Chitinophaga sp.]|uniref:hypothetical protein n=1 Tax=Chitinophaga sp. TaxID=1869181 RepID=UPI002DBA4F4C|nr:hypothetical protein [Chitinophaga sp.]HEU4553040.1 hypothetical protein [Chitinophaga sp.]
MKSVIPLVVAAMLLLTVAGCRKYPDQLPNYPHYQVQKIKIDPGGFGEDSAVFAYNAIGNPVSITRGRPSTGAPNYLFRYDAQHRLTDYIGVYANGLVFETWHHYTYNNHDNIVTDTTYVFGIVTDHGPAPDPQAPPPYDHLFVGHTTAYEYDAQHRIIRAYDDFGQPPVSTTRYIYNADGNLAVIRSYDPYTADSSDVALTSYDNKVNLHRTHPIWQFLDRDYSVNNHEQVTAYNAQGLPLVIQAPANTEISQSFISLWYTIALHITYGPRR